ncbi:hypothetical protein PAT3040_02759 [Paenibacillus agaridevorans]|uniref:Uncharacterized protein n=1 Tax=Paenibacillus agaridevorans TaxID=171404 RepID=A0A2R5EXV3_9BACL|nr:hypothetical protein PAT3040_02759 [Paenibacillus agaridevorans]
MYRNIGRKDSNLEQLEEKGLVKDASSIDGVLLRVESTEIMENKVTIKGSVY